MRGTISAAILSAALSVASAAGAAAIDQHVQPLPGWALSQAAPQLHSQSKGEEKAFLQEFQRDQRQALEERQRLQLERFQQQAERQRARTLRLHQQSENGQS